MKNSENNKRLEIIRKFCLENSNQKIVEKYAKYFKTGYDAYGIDNKIFAGKKDEWIKEWESEVNLEDYLSIADELMESGKFEEKSFAIWFLHSQSGKFNQETFKRIGNWFDHGVNNWATTDVLSMLVLTKFFENHHDLIELLLSWKEAESEWQRRSVPVTLLYLINNELDLEIILNGIESMMMDTNIYVQKALGTLLRAVWKNNAELAEEFLLKWKNTCPRPIIQYATEKMDKEHRKIFRRDKQLQTVG